MDKVFYVDLLSNASMDVHPDNKLSSFTNILATPIELNEPYEVALNETVYPLNFSQTVEIEYGFVTIKSTPKIKKEWFGGRLKFKFDGSSKLKDILASFSSQSTDNLTSILSDKKLTLMTRPTLEYKEDKDRAYIKIGELANGWILLLYFFTSGDFITPLGFEASSYKDFFESAKPGDRFYAAYPPYLTARSNLLSINTDIVSSHRVGDSASNTLRTIPLSKGVYENVQYISFTNQHYFPVRFSRIDRISIKITDENGDPIRFRRGRVFISLKEE